MYCPHTDDGGAVGRELAPPDEHHRRQSLTGLFPPGYGALTDEPTIRKGYDMIVPKSAPLGTPNTPARCVQPLSVGGAA